MCDNKLTKIYCSLIHLVIKFRDSHVLFNIDSAVCEAERQQVVEGSNPIDVINSISDMRLLHEEGGDGSLEAPSNGNSTAVTSKSSNGKLVLLE